MRRTKGVMARGHGSVDAEHRHHINLETDTCSCGHLAGHHRTDTIMACRLCNCEGFYIPAPEDA